MDSSRKYPDDIKEDYLVRLEYLKHLVNLMDDIYLSVRKNYGTAMHPHMLLCVGTLRVACHNAEATIHLVDAELIHQVHYISRNMWELTINLYYILDKESQRDARLERYLRYGDEVLPFKLLEAVKDHFEDDISEQLATRKEKKYRTFQEEYKTSKGKAPDTSSWSGMNMYDMVDKLNNEEIKTEFKTFYKLLVKSNNLYLHPSWLYLKEAIAYTMGSYRDYQSRMNLMNSVFTAGKKIVEKVLEHFPEGRPEFQWRMVEINGWFRSKKNRQLPTQDEGRVSP
jgi:Family of unknown function (DUF5677)